MRKERNRQEREVVTQSLILKKRDEDLDKIKSIDMVNRSLEVEQIRLMKEFSRQTRVNKHFRTLSQTPRDHPKLTNLPPLVKDLL